MAAGLPSVNVGITEMPLLVRLRFPEMWLTIFALSALWVKAACVNTKREKDNIDFCKVFFINSVLIFSGSKATTSAKLYITKFKWIITIFKQVLLCPAF